MAERLSEAKARQVYLILRDRILSNAIAPGAPWPRSAVPPLPRLPSLGIIYQTKGGVNRAECRHFTMCDPMDKLTQTARPGVEEPTIR